MLREVVREIFDAWSPNYLELPLTGAVSQPVKSHVDGFGAALFRVVKYKNKDDQEWHIYVPREAEVARGREYFKIQ